LTARVGRLEGHNVLGIIHVIGWIEFAEVERRSDECRRLRQDL
jgi:hypothetical protein